ncbi:MAG: hypothetical protein WD359_04235 [Dehalococcoidia bacterium]
MTALRYLFAVAAMLAGLTIFGACDGDGGSNDDGTPSAVATGGGDEGDTRDLAAIARRFNETAFRGEYDLTGSVDESEFTNAKLVIYKDGVDRLRFDLSAEEDGEATEVIFIQTPEISAFCLRNAGEFGLLLGVAEDEGVCFNDDPSGGGGAGDYSEIIEQIESGEGEIVERSEREIAGEDGDCYRIRDAEGNVSDACFSGDGYLLAVNETDGSGLEATSVSGTVDDGDFDPPYELRDLPDFGGEE